MNDILLAVRNIYDFIPEDEMEELAFKEVCGLFLYNAVKIYQKAGISPERACKFLEKIIRINQINSVISQG